MRGHGRRMLIGGGTHSNDTGIRKKEQGRKKGIYMSRIDNIRRKEG